MKKLLLELDALEVESFSTLADEKKQGTVEGQEWSEPWNSECWDSKCCPRSESAVMFCLCASIEEASCDTCNAHLPTCDGNSLCSA